jgi:hypothetical protein
MPVGIACQSEHDQERKMRRTAQSQVLGYHRVGPVTANQDLQYAWIKRVKLRSVAELRTWDSCVCVRTLALMVLPSIVLRRVRLLPSGSGSATIAAM